jgi:signal transduction histidine kinase
VIRNLLSNALKFTPSGGKVTISASHIHDTIMYKGGTMSGIHKLLRIEVKDTGAGISQVFEFNNDRIITIRINMMFVCRRI